MFRPTSLRAFPLQQQQQQQHFVKTNNGYLQYRVHRSTPSTHASTNFQYLANYINKFNITDNM